MYLYPTLFNQLFKGGHLGHYQYFAPINNCMMNHHVNMLFVLVEVYSQQKFLGVGLLRQKVNTCGALLGIAIFPSLVIVPFCPLSRICQSCGLTASLTECCTSACSLICQMKNGNSGWINLHISYYD